jgi:hypothetical protein
MLSFTKVRKVRKVEQVTVTSHIARPPNCFMIWSSKMREHIYINKPKLNNVEISKMLGLMWINMSIEDKLPYLIEADKIKHEHKLKNPNYKYTPNTKKQKDIIKDNAMSKVNKVKSKRVYKPKKLNIILNRKPIVKNILETEIEQAIEQAIESEIESEIEPEVELNTDFLIKEPDYFLEVQQFYAKL